MRLTCINCRNFKKIYKASGGGYCSILDRLVNMHDISRICNDRFQYNDDIERLKADLKELEYHLKDLKRRIKCKEGI